MRLRNLGIALVSTLVVACGESPTNTADTGGSVAVDDEQSSAGASGVGGAVATGGTAGTTSTGGAMDDGGESGAGGSATGGQTTGGETNGGSDTGGQATGGETNGGSDTGGQATGGEATAGSDTGGQATAGESSMGGANTGGEAAGGQSAMGGANTGGEGGEGGSTAVGCSPPTTYPNLFVTVSGHTQEESDAKVSNAWSSLFNPSGSGTIYFDGPGSDESYVQDIYNNDVRSEGMSYGMMAAVQLDHQTEFDRLWTWVRNHMAQGCSGDTCTGEVAWSCATSGSKKSTGGAPDGEEYMATALIFADNRWGDTGKYNYAS